MEFIYFLKQSTFMALLCFFWVIIVKLFKKPIHLPDMIYSILATKNSQV